MLYLTRQLERLPGQGFSPGGGTSLAILSEKRCFSQNSGVNVEQVQQSRPVKPIDLRRVMGLTGARQMCQRLASGQPSGALVWLYWLQPVT